MRFALTLLGMSLLPNFASAAADCSRAAEGIVVLRYENEPLPHAGFEKAIYDAMPCLSTQNAFVKEKIEGVVRQGTADWGPEFCRLEERPATAAFTSWASTRPSIDNEISGEAEYAVMPQVSCSGVGTGMFGGITASTVFFVRLDQKITGILGSSAGPRVNTIILTLVQN